MARKRAKVAGPRSMAQPRPKGVFSSMRGGLRGFFHGSKGGAKRKPTTFWDVLFYLLLGFFGAWAVWRWLA